MLMMSLLGFHVPSLYFVSKNATVKVSPQPSIPFDTVEARDLALKGVNGAYTPGNFNVTWTLVVAYDDKTAGQKGIANLAP